MEEEMQGILIKSVHHNKLWGAVKPLGDLVAIQESLHGLEERANNDLVKLARANNLALSLVWTNSCHPGHLLAGEQLCWNRPEGRGRQQPKRDLAGCLGIQQHPGLH